MIVSPNEIFAVTAESWMFEESRHKFVVLNLVDGLLLQGPLPGPGPAWLHQAGIAPLLGHFHSFFCSALAWPFRLVWSALYSSLKLKERIVFIVIGAVVWCGAREVGGKWISENIKLER